MAGYSEQGVTCGSLTLNVLTGQGAGPPLVLLHGVTRCGRDWQILFPTLGTLGRVHALDLRGHGLSDRATDGYRVIDYVTDVDFFLSTLEEPVVLVGHSLGAMVAAAVAARQPDRVRSLVLEDPTFEMTGRRIDETGFLDLFRAYRPFVGSPLPNGQLARELAAQLVRAPGGVRQVPLGSIRDPAALRFIAACLKRLDPAVLTPTLEGCWLEGYDVFGTLTRLRCPVLFLQGDYAAGGALPDDYAAELCERIADVSFIKLSGVGHNIHASQPEAMLRVVLPFLQSID